MMTKTERVVFRVCSAVESAGLLGVMFLIGRFYVSPEYGFAQKVMVMPGVLVLVTLTAYAVHGTLFGPKD